MSFTPDEVAQRYFEEAFIAHVTREPRAKRRPQPLSLLASLEARYGCTFSPDLRRLIAIAEQWDLSAVCAGEWQHMTDALAPYEDEKNLLAQAATFDQKNYLGTALNELLCNLVPIGYARNGDVYLVYVDPIETSRDEVFLWDHEEHSLSVFADSIASLAYLTHLYEVDHGEVEVEGDVLDVLREGLTRLEKRVSPSWHYRSLCEKAEVSPSYEATTAAEFLYVRGDWVDALVRTAGKSPEDAKARVIAPLEEWHSKNSFADAAAGPRFKRAPMSVYWLFYQYFFDDNPGLEQAIALLRESSSRFARDAASFFAEVIANESKKPKAKTKLGKIADVAALRKKFIAAETGGARQRREDAERERAAAERARIFAEADTLAQGKSPDELETLARAHAATPPMVERLYHHLRAVDAEVDRTMKRLDVLADSDRYREHKIVHTWLMTHGSRRIVPLLEARGAKPLLSLFAPRPEPTLPAAPAATREAFGILRTKTSREALASVVASGTEDHLAVLDELLGERRGQGKYIVFERTMREALASRLGKPVALDVVRRALRLTYSDRDRTSRLHTTALRVLAAHAPKDEVRATALRFLTWDLPEVRAVARNVLLALGEPDETRILDPISVADAFDANGVEALREALRDPWAYPKWTVLELAGDKNVGAALADDAIAAFAATYFAFEEGYGYYSGNYDVMLRTAAAIMKIPGAGVDAFIRRLVTSPSAMLAPVVDDAELRERGRNAGSLERVRAFGDATIETFSAPPFVLGGTIHGLTVAAAHVVAGGNESSAFFDADGARTPLPDEVRAGWSYDVDVDPTGTRVALGYHGGHLVVLDVAAKEIVGRTKLGGVPNGIRKLKWSPSGRFLATASDDDTVRVVDTTSFTEVMRHTEPYDVNGIAWLEEDQIAFITDQHVGVIARAGGEPQRIDGGGADVIVHDGLIVAATSKKGIVWLDPKTLKTKKKLAAKSVARVRIAPDGAVWAAVYEGDERGLLRWAPGTKEATRVFGDEDMFALALDPTTGNVVCGGKRGRVRAARADGSPIAPPATSHLGPVVALTTQGVPAAHLLALDGAQRALVWNVGAHPPTARASWGEVDGKGAPQIPRLTDDGALIVSRMNQVSRFETDGVKWTLDTERCEATILVGNEVVLGSGRELLFVDAKTGAVVARGPAGVRSSWVHYLFATGSDDFVVAGYDDPKLARWSASERAQKQSTMLDRRHEDERFSRAYGMALGPGPHRHLYVAYWNETVDVIDSTSLALLRTYDVNWSYAVLAVDTDERWLLAATGDFVDVIDIATGRTVASRAAGAEVLSLCFVGPCDALIGTKSGAIQRITWKV